MRTTLLTGLLLLLVAYAGYGQQPLTATASETVVTFKFVPGEDMFYIPYGGNWNNNAQNCRSAHRNNVNPDYAMYLNHGQLTGKKGRPRKYAGKIDIAHIDKDYFTLVLEKPEHSIYSAVVYSKSLKRNIRLAYVVYNMKNGKQSVKLYYSTDLDLSAEDILLYYQSRFQIEFIYRDGKQFTGLCDVQARGENKLNFHFNASLTAINIAKVHDWLGIPVEERKAFSLSDIKTLNHNKLLLCRFFDVFGIDPHKPKNKKYINELIYYGTMAA